MKTKKRDPRRPTLPVPRGTSTIGAAAFHCQVRDGAGWAHRALATSLFFTDSVTNPIVNQITGIQRGLFRTALFAAHDSRFRFAAEPQPEAE